VKTTLEFIASGANVSRYHTVTTVRSESVGHHSHGVALLATLLNPLASRALLLSALYHDLAEHQTGDIPSPAKRAYGIGEQVAQLECRLLRDAGIPMPELTPEDERTLSLADIAQGALYCVSEMNLGNKGARVIYDRYMSYARSLILVGRERELFNTIEGMIL